MLAQYWFIFGDFRGRFADFRGRFLPFSKPPTTSDEGKLESS
jgi:hypothetical protein